MGVDYFWKRVPAETIGATTPKGLAHLVPHWFDDDFTSRWSMLPRAFPH